METARRRRFRQFKTFENDNNLSAGLAGIIDLSQEDNYYTTKNEIPIFNNPDFFELETKLDTISTYNGAKTYYVGADGMPQTKDTFYAVDSDILLLAKVDIPCKEVLADGTVIHVNSVIPAGTFFKAVGSTADAAIVKISLNYSPQEGTMGYYQETDKTYYKTDVFYLLQLDDVYTHSIGDVSIYDMLDGMVFAG